jgi:hypothetical protein
MASGAANKKFAKDFTFRKTIWTNKASAPIRSEVGVCGYGQRYSCCLKKGQECFEIPLMMDYERCQGVWEISIYDSVVGSEKVSRKGMVDIVNGAWTA